MNELTGTLVQVVFGIIAVTVFLMYGKQQQELVRNRQAEDATGPRCPLCRAEADPEQPCPSCAWHDAYRMDADVATWMDALAVVDRGIDSATAAERARVRSLTGNRARLLARAVEHDRDATAAVTNAVLVAWDLGEHVTDDAHESLTAMRQVLRARVRERVFAERSPEGP